MATVGPDGFPPMPPTSGWSAADADRLNLLKAEAVRADLELQHARANAAALHEVTDRLERRREDQLAPSVSSDTGGALGAPSPLASPCSKQAADEGARSLLGLPAGREVPWRPSQREVVQAASIPGASVLLTAPTGWGGNALPALVAKACCNRTLVLVVAPCRAVALQMVKDHTKPALGLGFRHSLVSPDSAPPVAEGGTDTAVSATQAAELAHEDRPRRGTTEDVHLAAVAGGCRVVVLTAEALSAISLSGVSVWVALGAVMAGLADASGPDYLIVVVDLPQRGRFSDRHCGHWWVFSRDSGSLREPCRRAAIGVGGDVGVRLSRRLHEVTQKHRTVG